MTTRLSLPCLLLLLAPCAPAAAAPPDALADLEGRADEVVRIHMNAATLAALSRAIPSDTGEDARFFEALSGASGINVVSLSFHDGAMPAPEDVEAVRASAVPAGWTRFLSSRSTDPDEMMAGYAGPGGLALVTAEPGEITAVHIDGVFPASAVPLLSHQFGLPAIGSGDAQPAFATRGGPSTGAAVHPEKLDFKRMVREIEAREGIRHQHVPLLGVASPVARIVSGGRVKALDLAVFEGVPASFVDAADRALPEGWSRFVEVRDGQESTNIYVGAVERNMPLLIATWDGDGVLLTMKASLKDLCRSPRAWADVGHDSQD
jgi:hypothetical protein